MEVHIMLVLRDAQVGYDDESMSASWEILRTTGCASDCQAASESYSCLVGNRGCRTLYWYLCMTLSIVVTATASSFQTKRVRNFHSATRSRWQMQLPCKACVTAVVKRACCGTAAHLGL